MPSPVGVNNVMILKIYCVFGNQFINYMLSKICFTIVTTNEFQQVKYNLKNKIPLKIVLPVPFLTDGNGTIDNVALN